jgi:hypothetical protein
VTVVGVVVAGGTEDDGYVSVLAGADEDVVGGVVGAGVVVVGPGVVVGAGVVFVGAGVVVVWAGTVGRVVGRVVGRRGVTAAGGAAVAGFPSAAWGAAAGTGAGTGGAGTAGAGAGRVAGAVSPTATVSTGRRAGPAPCAAADEPVDEAFGGGRGVCAGGTAAGGPTEGATDRIEGPAARAFEAGAGAPVAAQTAISAPTPTTAVSVEATAPKRGLGRGSARVNSIQSASTASPSIASTAMTTPTRCDTSTTPSVDPYVHPAPRRSPGRSGPAVTSGGAVRARPAEARIRSGA